MSDSQRQRDEMVMDVFLIPSLETATRQWQEARRKFQQRSDAENLSACNAATGMMYLAFVTSNAADPLTPETFEAFHQHVIDSEPDSFESGPEDN